jgi:hypothetical protein
MPEVAAIQRVVTRNALIPKHYVKSFQTHLISFQNLVKTFFFTQQTFFRSDMNVYLI